MIRSLGLLVLAAVTLFGCTPRKAIANGAISLKLVVKTGNAADGAFAAHAKSEEARCLRAHGTKTPGYKTCYQPTEKKLLSWHQLRAIISGLTKAGFHALKAGLAFLDGKAGGAKITAGQVAKIVAGVTCALYKGALLIGEKVPKLGDVLKPLDPIAKGVCP